MTVQRGENFDYMDMNFDINSEGKVTTTMYDHIKKILKEFCDSIRNKS